MCGKPDLHLYQMTVHSGFQMLLLLGCEHLYNTPKVVECFVQNGHLLRLTPMSVLAHDQRVSDSCEITPYSGWLDPLGRVIPLRLSSSARWQATKRCSGVW